MFQSILQEGNVKGLFENLCSMGKVCDEVKAVRDLHDRVSSGGGYEVVMTARKRCWRVKSRECDDLLYLKRFPLRKKCSVCMGYVRSAILF